MMMNQGSNTQNVAPVEMVENRYVTDASIGTAPSYFPSMPGAEAASWSMPGADNYSINNETPSYDYRHPTGSIQEGINSTTSTNLPSLGTANASQEYNSYPPSYSHPNSTDPHGYGNTGYPSYYSNYHQQTTHSYAQPAGSYQNTGAPYQPISSFQNTGSHAGTASYSSTYYNHGNYQTAGAYPSGGYGNQTAVWNEANAAHYPYSNYSSETTGAYSSTTAAAASQQYQQHYKQWADYSSQPEVTCAPGTENLTVSSTSIPTPGYSAPGSNIMYTTSNDPPPPPPPSFHPSWRPDSGSSEVSIPQPNATGGTRDNYLNQGVPSFQDHYASPMQTHFQKPYDLQSSYNNFQDQQKSTLQQVPNSQYTTPIQHPQSYQSPHQVSQTYQSPHQVSQTYQSPHQVSQSHQPSHQVPQGYQSHQQSVPSLDFPRVSTLQIPTNPRIAPNFTLGSLKSDKESSTAGSTEKPAYISVSLPKPNDHVPSNDVADCIIKPGTFPKSLRGYVERALARCKDDPQMKASQDIMKEIITKATSDGTLQTRDWDTEPLFPLPNPNLVKKDNLLSSTPLSPMPMSKKSPRRRSKSRWEPLPEEIPVVKPVLANDDALNYGSWDRKLINAYSSKEDGLSNAKFLVHDKKTAGKNAHKPPVKRQRLSAVINAAFDKDDDVSSGSDKEQSLTAYYTGAIALANSPDERKKRESRSKRFEKRQAHQLENNHFKPKVARAENLYTRKASALMLAQNFDDGGSMAVEDIDWDALTIKGTCQEIEKRYLRLTSAPDPSSVRPEEVLEKALLMVQNSPKNYLYKCDQLKSIRQDLTVQRIRNQLTVKVYETHARLALEAGDLPEYNQCQSQLKILYAEGNEGCCMEFAAYNLLCVILHSNNNRDLISSMSRLSVEAKRDKAVKHALAVRAAVTSGNYVMFFKLHKAAPNLNACLMDLCVEKVRYKAVSCMSRSYRPIIPVSYIANVLGFVMPINEANLEKDSDGLEECIEWLKTHGACLTADDNGEMQLDAKASSSSLFMPEPGDAVAHGDATLAVNDFMARTSL